MIVMLLCLYYFWNDQKWGPIVYSFFLGYIVSLTASSPVHHNLAMVLGKRYDLLQRLEALEKNTSSMTVQKSAHTVAAADQSDKDDGDEQPADRILRRSVGYPLILQQ
jgi:hypothetical protein